MSKPHGPSLKAIANGPRERAPRAPLQPRSVPTLARASALRARVGEKLDGITHVRDRTPVQRRLDDHYRNALAIENRLRRPPGPRPDRSRSYGNGGGYHDARTGGWYTGD